MGVSIAIDDFGTGFSSLVQLQRLPVDEIKIDRSFVATMAHSESDTAIVRSTIDLARNLGLHVTAEGVETEAARAQLAAMGCELAQGYGLCPPLPAAQCARVVREHSPAAEPAVVRLDGRGGRRRRSRSGSRWPACSLLAPAARPPPRPPPHRTWSCCATASPRPPRSSRPGRAACFLKLRLRYDDALDGFAADLTGAQLAALQPHPAVAFVQPDATVTGRRQRRPGQRRDGPRGHPPRGRRHRRRRHPAATAAVAVLDSGVDLTNPDLDARNGTNCISPHAPRRTTAATAPTSPVIGARNTGSGVTGVAPGTTIYAVKILGNNGSGTLSQILCGINWVTANASRLGIRVANMSVSGHGAQRRQLRQHERRLLAQGHLRARPQRASPGSSRRATPAPTSPARSPPPTPRC